MPNRTHRLVALASLLLLRSPRTLYLTATGAAILAVLASPLKRHDDASPLRPSSLDSPLPPSPGQKGLHRLPRQRPNLPHSRPPTSRIGINNSGNPKPTPNNTPRANTHTNPQHSQTKNPYTKAKPGKKGIMPPTLATLQQSLRLAAAIVRNYS